MQNHQDIQKNTELDLPLLKDLLLDPETYQRVTTIQALKLSISIPKMIHHQSDYQSVINELVPYHQTDDILADLNRIKTLLQARNWTSKVTWIKTGAQVAELITSVDHIAPIYKAITQEVSQRQFIAYLITIKKLQAIGATQSDIESIVVACETYPLRQDRLRDQLKSAFCTDDLEKIDRSKAINTSSSFELNAAEQTKSNMLSQGDVGSPSNQETLAVSGLRRTLNDMGSLVFSANGLYLAVGMLVLGLVALALAHYGVGYSVAAIIGLRAAGAIAVVGGSIFAGKAMVNYCLFQPKTREQTEVNTLNRDAKQSLLGCGQAAILGER
ncbi:MAG: hypothetical protein Q8R24_02465 [Legionellaceae bacterium]|nr:hypothetical protein [Legionellaceae bacterium]